MKVAVTGKGGVGKTTVAASLARCWRDLGYRVVAVDADPDANLAGTLGYRGPAITPLVKLKALIEERVGGGEGWGGFLRMNPRVDDIPREFGVVVDGVRLLVMGTIERGRRGCACPENILLRVWRNAEAFTAFAGFKAWPTRFRARRTWGSSDGICLECRSWGRSRWI